MGVRIGAATVGAMQYGGVTIGEAMMNGQVVFRSSIYPVSGTWGPTALVGFTSTSVVSHTLASSGHFTLSGTSPSGGYGAWFRNGASLTGDLSWSGELASGDIVDFRVVALSNGTFSGTWSIAESSPGGPELPVLYVTGQDWWESEGQVIAELANYSLTKATVTEFPFFIDVSQSSDLSGLFADCPNLVHVPAISDTGHIVYMDSMFESSSSVQTVPDLQTQAVASVNDMFAGCAALTDGNVRLVGRKSGVTTDRAILGSGLTRVPFFDSGGNPI